MKLSYWEYKTWLSDIDFTIVGSGIVGLNCALALRKKFPKSKIVILEKGFLPQGASTKNAGFACFGSISEILADLQTHTENEVLQLVEKRLKGIQLLRDNLGDDAIDFKCYGGHELFTKGKNDLYLNCLDNLDRVNRLLKPIFKSEPFEIRSNSFRFKGIEDQYISHQFEAQIDTGKMMDALLTKAQTNGIKILNTIEVETFQSENGLVEVKTNVFHFQTKKLCIATNGFASQLLKEDVVPARAQVIITKPIPNLKIKGTFHLDEGYYYFRNINDRILFGGGRNLDFDAEETFEHGETQIVQTQLAKMLKEIILPNATFEIEQRWSGIMGVGNIKKPIVRLIDDNVYCGVRLGGMGVAIGSHIGLQMANLAI